MDIARAVSDDIVVPQPIIVQDAASVERTLAGIGGLTTRILLNAVEEGERGRQNTTDNHPVTAGGTLAYFDTVRSLRDQLLPEWSKKCDGGSELTISPDGRFAIVVAAGNANVGKQTAPRTKRKKGPKSKKAAKANVAVLLQTDLFALREADAAAIIEQNRTSPERLTYVLLTHRTDEELVVELSLMTGFDEDSYIDAWGMRVLVGTLPLSVRVPPSGANDDTPDFDVTVVRRRS